MDLLQKLLLQIIPIVVVDNDKKWPRYSLKNVKQNRKNGWIVIDGNVLNIMPYIKSGKHPVGSDILREHCGTDATLYFDKVGHSDLIYKYMLSFKIGIIE